MDLIKRLERAHLLCFAVNSAPDLINEKTEVLHGKMQDQLISANIKNRALLHSVAHAAFYSPYPTQGQKVKQQPIKIRNLMAKYKNNVMSKHIQVFFQALNMKNESIHFWLPERLHTSKIN